MESLIAKVFVVCIITTWNLHVIPAKPVQWLEEAFITEAHACKLLQKSYEKLPERTVACEPIENVRQELQLGEEY